jgi:hypothetical protein
MNRTLIAALVMASIFGTISCAKSGSGDAATNNTNTTATTSSSKDITTFSILGQAGTIGTNTIGVTVPFGTNLTALVATFTINGTSMEISGVTQVSGTTANNFTTAKNYTVIAADGSTKTYTVTVNTNAKDITAFSILGQTGTIGASTVNVTVPYGTNVTALVPTFTITGASVNIASVNQTSGTTAKNSLQPLQ